MAKRDKTFPAQIFVQEEGEGQNKFWAVHKSAEDAAEAGVSVTIGIYKLVRVAKVQSKIEVV